MILDKLRVRDYVINKVGSDCLIPLLWSGGNPEEIPFDELPSNFVIKTNHASWYNIIVKDKTKIDRKNVIKQLNKWLCENFSQDTYLGIAWGYKNIKPAVIIESFIGKGEKVPLDYKFYCLAGRVEALTMQFDRFVNQTAIGFDRDFRPHAFRSSLPRYYGPVRRPDNFDSMVQIAESIAEGFDFMRVDLYSLGKKIYVGELTPYPGGVTTKFLPTREDFRLGEIWGCRKDRPAIGQGAKAPAGKGLIGPARLR